MTEDIRIELFCKNRIKEIKSLFSSQNQGQNNLIRIKNEQNPEYYPERGYTGPNDYNLASKQNGFIYSNSERYPLFVNRLGRNFYYHIIDENRNRIRIPLNVPKNEELDDKDTVTVPELNGDYTVKLYENSGNLYNPFAI